MRFLSARFGNANRDTIRIEAFSDGVIAIAITLLILEIHVPSVEETAAETGLWHALANLWPSYLGYAISFFTIGIIWANHHNIFRFFKGVDHYLLLINTAFLFCVAFLPFPTAVLAEHLNHEDEKVSAVFYAGTFLVVALVYNLLWRYPSRIAPTLLVDDADGDTIASITRRFNFGPPAYFAAFITAFFSPYASLAILAALALLYLLPQE